MGVTTMFGASLTASMTTKFIGRKLQELPVDFEKTPAIYCDASGMSRLRAIAALSTALVALVTVLTAFGVARSNHVYLGGLAWPFISDLGRGKTDPGRLDNCRC